MNTIEIEKYLDRIKSEQNVLITKLHDDVLCIEMPSAQIPQTINSDSHEGLGQNEKIAIGVGGAITIVGFFADKPWNWMLPLVGLGAIGYGVRNKFLSKVKQETPENQAVDYYAISSQLNRKLSTISKNIVNAWDEFIKSQKDELKNSIMQLDVDVDTKTTMMDMATNVSVLDYSTSSLFVRLNSLAGKSDISGMKSLIVEFEDDLKAAINKTCGEQISTWSAIK